MRASIPEPLARRIAHVTRRGCDLLSCEVCVSGRMLAKFGATLAVNWYASRFGSEASSTREAQHSHDRARLTSLVIEI